MSAGLCACVGGGPATPGLRVCPGVRLGVSGACYGWNCVPSKDGEVLTSGAYEWDPTGGSVSADDQAKTKPRWWPDPAGWSPYREGTFRHRRTQTMCKHRTTSPRQGLSEAAGSERGRRDTPSRPQMVRRVGPVHAFLTDFSLRNGEPTPFAAGNSPGPRLFVTAALGNCGCLGGRDN